MKTLTGKVITLTPISLSKASKVLSNFVSADTVASQAVSGYLRRATAAFDELVQLHKELKTSKKPIMAEEDGVGTGKKRKIRENSGSGKKKKRRIESEQ